MNRRIITGSNERPATLDDLRRLLERMCRDIEKLEQSAFKLADRINAFDDEEARRPMSWYKPPKGPMSLEQIRSMLNDALEHLDGSIRDFSAMRAKIDRADEGAYLTDELLPHMKRRK